MKICVRCKIKKEFKEFRKYTRSKDGHESACKECRRKYDNQTYKTNEERRKAVRRSAAEKKLEIRKWIRQYLELNPCVDCSQSDPELLEFDHVTGQKFAGIAQLVQRRVALEVIKKEIEKCEVRCLYCHRKKTIKQLGWYASLV